MYGGLEGLVYFRDSREVLGCFFSISIGQDQLEESFFLQVYCYLYGGILSLQDVFYIEGEV